MTKTPLFCVFPNSFSFFKEKKIHLSNRKLFIPLRNTMKDYPLEYGLRSSHTTHSRRGDKMFKLHKMSVSCEGSFEMYFQDDSNAF